MRSILFAGRFYTVFEISMDEHLKHSIIDTVKVLAEGGGGGEAEDSVTY